MTEIAFLGFGEAGRAFQATLAAADPSLTFAAWDVKLDGPDAGEMRSAMAAAGVRVAGFDTLLIEADWLFSAVTADQSLVALEAFLPSMRPGLLVIDINSVSPGRKRTTAERVRATGARYLDMAVMAPVHPKGHRTPVFVAGDIDEAALDRAGFDWQRAGDDPGQATAIKMVRSVFVKGLEAITAEALLAAELSGCFDEIVASLSKSYPGLGWPDHATYVFDRTLTHGARRAAEMRESGATLDELGLLGTLARAVAEVQDAQGAVGTGPLRCGDGGDGVANLRQTVARTLAARLGEDDGRSTPERA